MRTVEEIKGRCRIDEDTGHWIWGGGTSSRLNGARREPRIYAPDYTVLAGGMQSQAGRRAVWHCLTGKAIPAGWRVFGTCDAPDCLNPAHMRCGSAKEEARHTVRTGRYRDQPKRITANRLTARRRSILTPELILEIQSSNETGVELSARLGIAPQLISKARRGEYTVHRAGNPFTGLIR